jgi:hypothetical protein
MFRGVKVRETVSADDLSPFLMRKLKSMFAVDGLPHLIFRRFRIEDQPIEVKEKSLDHSRQIIPEQMACYTLDATVIARSHEVGTKQSHAQ